MSALSFYHWDYDHRAPSTDPFHTFSIAIFQWQPKASGKGLKKVNASRVCGYAADPKSIYAKAQEVCDRLNCEEASVLKRPGWLKKQYLVPRPKWLAPEPQREHLQPATVRSIRKSVMRRSLLPLGFVSAKRATYVREVNEQIHLIYFQGSRWGGSYTVNIGFHYAFMTPFFAGKRVPLSEYDLLDCAFQSRLGPFLTGRDMWFDYGSDRQSLAQSLEQNVVDGLKILSRFSKRWADPEQWLDAPRRRALSTRLACGSWSVPESNRFLSMLDRHFRKRPQPRPE